MRTIRQIIIHCSDSDVPSHDNIETIKKWHVEERGWSDIGYHYFIDSKGEAFEGRPIHRAGAHCQGQNSDSIGICLHGRNEFTKAQFAALRRLVFDLKVKYPMCKVVGHNHYDKTKTCPNFDVEQKLYS